MQLINGGGAQTPVYCVSGPSTARNLPTWLDRRRRRSQKKAEEDNRVELLQEFGFPEASNCVRVSRDGNWVMSTGTYKPRINLHNVLEMSLSFERHTTAENVSFELLSDDYSKSAHLQSNRYVELHTAMGKYFEVRLPRFGRDLAYARDKAELLIPAVGLAAGGSHGEVFRLNLELGQFQRPYEIDIGEDGAEGLQGGIDVGAVNVAAIAEKTHGLQAFGTSRGSVEFWDNRSKERVAALQHHHAEITALAFSADGLQIFTGTGSGLVSIYDIRSPSALLNKNHGFGFPIKKLIPVHTADGERKLLASDKRAVGADPDRIIKILDDRGNLFTTYEPTVDINDVAWIPDTGMLLTANEGPQQHILHIPDLGPAPRWCSFLDNIIYDEKSVASTETYTNFKFLTLPELSQLNLKHLIGKTNLLRPYMHGFFVDSRLYDQARLIVNPYVWEEERSKRIKEKMEKDRSSRIRGIKKVNVNQHLVDKLLKKQENRGKIDPEAGLLGDSRFKKIFEDSEFKVDKNSHEFRALNPSTTVPRQETPTKYGGDASSDHSSDDDDNDNNAEARLQEVDKIVMRITSSHVKNDRSKKDMSLGSRAQKSGRVGKGRRSDTVGEKSITFVPEARSKGKSKIEDFVPASRRSKGRRSASNNTFRGL